MSCIHTALCQDIYTDHIVQVNPRWNQQNFTLHYSASLKWTIFVVLHLDSSLASVYSRIFRQRSTSFNLDWVRTRLEPTMENHISLISQNRSCVTHVAIFWHSRLLARGLTNPIRPNFTAVTMVTATLTLTNTEPWLQNHSGFPLTAMFSDSDSGFVGFFILWHFGQDCEP